MYEFDMSGLELFTGGPLDTNAYFLETPGGNVLFDAPQGSDAHFAGRRVDWLILTHGHFDHTADAAGIRRRHGCRIGFHEDTTPMVKDREFFRRFGFELEIEPFDADFLIGEGDVTEVAGLAMQALLVPGHCPGSLCFFLRDRGILIGGDVLFRGGVGGGICPVGTGHCSSGASSRSSSPCRRIRLCCRGTGRRQRLVRRGRRIPTWETDFFSSTVRNV